jgi:hypothetical protein
MPQHPPERPTATSPVVAVMIALLLCAGIVGLFIGISAVR